MKTQESHASENDEYEDLDGDEEIDYDDDEDGMDTSHHTVIEETFLHSSDTSDPYVLEAIDASLDYGYFNASSAPTTSDNGSIYYSSLPAKQLLDSIKPNISTAFSDQEPPNTAGEPIEPRVFLNDGTTDQAKIDLILQEFGLSKDQTKAFRIVADHSLGRGKFGPQLRMGVFGEGGTGKSRLIDAIRAWFACIGRESELAVTATTGAAAYNINGATIHSSLAIPPQDNGDEHWTQKISEERLKNGNSGAISLSMRLA